MIEVIKSFKSTEEYIEYIQQNKIDELYKEAVDSAIEKEAIDDLIVEAFTELADAEAELSILEDLFINGKVNKKEVTTAKRRYTKAKNNLDSLYMEKEGKV